MWAGMLGGFLALIVVGVLVVGGFLVLMMLAEGFKH